MSDTLAQHCFNDPHVRQARAQLADAVARCAAKLTGIRPGTDALRDAYARMLEQFGELRGGALFYRYLGTGLGHGPLVELADGSVKYDLINGIGVHGLGHSHPRLIEAGLDAALRDTVMQGNLQQNLESLDVARRLVDLACESGAALRHAFLTTSGAMANENALKMIFQARHPADRLLAFEHAFAGRTLTLAQVTDKAAYRDGLPTTVAVDYVPFFDAADPAGSSERALTTLRTHLARHPGRYAGMVLELVLGEGGYYPGERDFFLALLPTLREHDVAVMVDEIQTFGRTTRPFAFQHFGLDELVDVVTVGKLTQLCATLFTDQYKPRPGLVSQTFTAATASIFAARAVLEELSSGGWFGPDGRNMQVHRRFVGHLRAIEQRHPGLVRGPFGLGSMIAFQFADGSPERTRQLLHALFDAGVIAFLAGTAPTRVRFLPPVGAIRDDQIDEVCTILERTMLEVAQTASLR